MEASLSRYEQLTPKYVIDAVTVPLPGSMALASPLQKMGQRKKQPGRQILTAQPLYSQTPGDPQDRFWVDNIAK